MTSVAALTFPARSVTVYDGNAALGLPRIQALVILLNGDDGSPLAVLDGASLTAIRTGADAPATSAGRASMTWVPGTSAQRVV